MAFFDIPVTITGYVRVHADSEPSAKTWLINERGTSHKFGIKFGIYEGDYLWVETIKVDAQPATGDRLDFIEEVESLMRAAVKGASAISQEKANYIQGICDALLDALRARGVA